MRKTAILSVLALLPLSFVLTVVARGQESSASLTETLTWLQGVINNNSSALQVQQKDATGEYQLSGFSFERCTISYKETLVAANGARFTTKAGQVDAFWWKTTVPLSAIDPLTIKLTSGQPYALEFHTSAGKKAIKQESDVDEDNGVMLNVNNIYIGDAEMAKRIERALKHAVNLCGGKVDPF